MPKLHEVGEIVLRGVRLKEVAYSGPLILNYTKVEIPIEVHGYLRQDKHGDYKLIVDQVVDIEGGEPNV